MGKEHTVPLTAPALAILRAQHAKRGKNPHVFPSPLPKQPLSNMALSMLMRRLGREETVHGMRAAFRSWAAKNAVAAEVAEVCLAHVADKVVRAYQRDDLLERRRAVMDAWAAYLAPPTAKVVKLPGKRRA